MPGGWIRASSAGPTAASNADLGGVHQPYRGRFAPSPTGPLHAGSLVAALASWLDARAHGGRWLLRIEDVDGPRCSPEAARQIVDQIAALGLLVDDVPSWQSQRSGAYDAVLQQLQAKGLAYPCGCSRSDIEAVWAARGLARQPGVDLPYPGICREGLRGKPVRAWRLRLPEGEASLVHWHDRRLGPQRQDVAAAVGDFVLRRADGLWAYQLAVVVDDAEQHISDVVRGEDLADNTARQILLQRALGLPTPRYLHTPLVWAADGRKLSKHNGAAAVDTTDTPAVLLALRSAGRALGLPERPPSLASPRAWLAAAVPAWAGIMAALDQQEHA
ncbi:MAG: tRNA glutamyl-Q(34) synthetase GluQRS [Rubrivivax sp.]